MPLTITLLFSFVFNASASSLGGKWVVIWSPMFATSYVSFATYFLFLHQVASTCCLQKKVIYHMTFLLFSG